MDPQEIKELVIASVTSALSAREVDPPEARLKQFSDDFVMIMDGIDAQELFKISSLLADFAGFLVSSLAQSMDADTDELMHYLATQMLNTRIVGVESGLEDLPD